MQAVSAAEEFEQKHYETNSAGEAQELDAGDFTRAAKQAGDSISSAAQSVKEAVVGPSDTKVLPASHLQPCLFQTQMVYLTCNGKEPP